MGNNITGFGLMTSSLAADVRATSKQQQTANAATKRLSGTTDPYSSNASRAAIGIDAEAQVGQYTQESQAAQQLLIKQQQMDSQIARATTASNDFRVYLNSLRTGLPLTDLGTIQARVSNALNAFTSTLNESSGGVFTLGGDKSQAACVDISIATTPLNASDPVDYSYYVGGGKAGTVVLGGVPLNQFAITANDPAFAHTLTAMRMMSNPALTDDPNDPFLVAAIQMLETGKAYYGNAISSSATNTRNVQAASEKLKTIISDSQNTIQTALGSDPHEDILAQVTAVNQLQMQQDLVAGKLESIERLISRVR